MTYSDDFIQKVWEKGAVVKGYNPEVLRKDPWGAWIIRNHFGHKSEYAWEVDRIDPNISESDIENLRPLQWENKSFRQGNKFLGRVTALHATNLRVR
jgi:hypothetical protein